MMDLKKLKDPFPACDIEWRIGRCGKQANGDKIWAVALAYITARAIHNRLDDVCGPGNWQLRYIEHLGGTICEIGIYINNQWVWKAGGSDQTDIEAFKGGLSGAEKRAGVPWGIGRYLYNLKEGFVQNISTSKQQGWNYQQANEKKGMPAFYWKPPELPKWALPTKQETLSQVIGYEHLQQFMDICKANNLDQAKTAKHYNIHYKENPMLIKDFEQTISVINQDIEAGNILFDLISGGKEE